MNLLQSFLENMSKNIGDEQKQLSRKNSKIEEEEDMEEAPVVEGPKGKVPCPKCSKMLKKKALVEHLQSCQ